MNSFQRLLPRMGHYTRSTFVFYTFMINLIIISGTSLAGDHQEKYERKATVGFEIDALPYFTGGYYGSAWLGFYNAKLRLRPVIAKSNIPDFILDEPYERNTIQVYALVVDYFFKKDFKGFWAGTGMEFWDGEIENNHAETSTYYSWIYTLGGGYVWKFWKNMYLNPWMAAHINVGGNKNIPVGGDIYKPALFTPEISLKLGWHF